MRSCCSRHDGTRYDTLTLLQSLREGRIFLSRHPERPAEAGPATWEDNPRCRLRRQGSAGRCGLDASARQRKVQRARWKATRTPGVFFEKEKTPCPETDTPGQSHAIELRPQARPRSIPTITSGATAACGGWRSRSTCPAGRRSASAFSLGTADVVEARRRRDKGAGRVPRRHRLHALAAAGAAPRAGPARRASSITCAA